MADSDDVILLESGHKDLQRCDLSGYSATGRHFVGVHFGDANLKDAIFSRNNFEGCNFTWTNLHSADLSSSRFVGCKFDGDYINVNFGDAVFEGGTFQGLVVGSSFRNATFVRVDAKRLHLGDSTIVDEAYADKSTDFRGAQMPRALSKLPVFSDYRFERGVLVRLDEAGIATNANQRESALELASIARKNVAVVLSVNTSGALVASLSLATLIGDFLANAPTPNDPEKFDFHQKYMELLVKIGAESEFISSCLSDVGGAQSIDEATDSILTVRELIQDWWSANGAKVVEYGANVGLIGIGTAFLSFCGAPPTMATAICAVLGGSKALSEYIGRTAKND